MKRVVISTVCLMVATLPSNAWDRQERRLVELGLSATAVNIAKVVVEKSCVDQSGDVITFRETPRQSPVFEHSGHAPAAYSISYSFVMILRKGELHSHVITVSPEKHLLFYNKKTYQC